MKKIFLLSAFAILLPLFANAQQWNLDRCIKHAIDKNLDIEEQRLNILKGEVTLNMSKKEWMPVVRADIGEDVSFGNMNASAGTMSTSSSSHDLSYTSAAISASMPLLDGYRTHNQIAANRFSLEAATQYLDAAKKDIAIQVATQYLQVLYYKGLVDIARSQLSISQEMAKRAEVLVSEGKRPASEKASADAQVASDQYALTQNESNAKLATIHLAQLLNIDDPSAFDIQEIVVDNITPSVNNIPSAQVIINENTELHPTVLAAKAEINAAEHLLKVAIRELYPRLTFNVSLQTYFYHLFQKPVDEFQEYQGTEIYDKFHNYFQYSEPGFASQFFDKNRSELVGLHLSIPIFNRYQTRGNIRKANIDILTRQNNLEKTRLKLRKEIQQAYYNATTAVSMYQSALKAAAAAEISQKYEKDRYDAGRSTLYELNTSSQKCLKAQRDVLQSKYEFMIRKRILEFYIK